MPTKRRRGLQRLLFCTVVLAGLAIILSAPPGHAQSDQISICLNVFVVGGTSAAIAQDPSYPSPDSLLGTPNPQAASDIRNALAQINAVWSQCHLGFSLNVLAVVRAGQLVLPSQEKTLLASRLQFGSYREALDVLANRSLPAATRVFRCLNMFFVDRLPPGLAGIAEVSQFQNGVVGLSLWDRETPYPIEATAHELGHNLGLFHSTDPANLMYPTLSGRTELTSSQCRTARSHGAALSGSQPTQILSFTSAPAPTASAAPISTLVFRSPDQDVAGATVRRLWALPDERLRTRITSTNPGVKGQTLGALRFATRCNGATAAWITVTLVDELGGAVTTTAAIDCPG